MTYKIPGTRYRAPRGLVRPGALGATMPAIPTVGGIESAADEIERTWKPTGFYTPQQMSDILLQCHKIYLKVLQPIDTYKASPDTFAKDVAQSLINKMTGYHKQLFDMYNPVIIAATRAGTKYIDAPGFRRNVISYLYGMSVGEDGIATIKRVNAEEWSRLPLAREILATTTAAAGVIRRIVGVAATIAAEAGNAVLRLPDTIGTAIKVAKWGVIAIAAMWIYGEVKDHRASSGG